MAPVVAVIGAGNVGCALAADLALRGTEVRLCTRSAQRLAPIRETGLTATGAVTGSTPIAVLTTSVHEAVTGAEIVAVTVPTPALPHYADALVEAVRPAQLLWLNPGHSGGALFLAAEFARRARSAPALCQLLTASHISRMSGPATVSVLKLAVAALAAFPAVRLDECFQRVEQVLPGQFSRAGTVLELDLMNVNAIMHPAQMVCNASWIEATGGGFAVYLEGSGPALGRVVDAVDIERLAIAERYEVPPRSFAALMREAGFTPAGDGGAYQALRAAESIHRVQAPPGLDHRYLHEDVAWGLVPWQELAACARIDVPTITSLTQLASTINGVDYRRRGLTLERMGLSGMRPEEVLAHVRGS